MEGRKVYGFAEEAKHKDGEDCWLIISGKVYDVTPYMEEHPGGDEVLLAVIVSPSSASLKIFSLELSCDHSICSGKDGTADFEDIGHSKAGKETMTRYYIGDIDPCTLPAKRVAVDALGARHEPCAGAGLWLTVLRIAVPLVVLGLAFAIQKLSMVKD